MQHFHRNIEYRSIVNIGKVAPTTISFPNHIVTFSIRLSTMTFMGRSFSRRIKKLCSLCVSSLISDQVLQLKTRCQFSFRSFTPVIFLSFLLYVRRIIRVGDLSEKQISENTCLEIGMDCPYNNVEVWYIRLNMRVCLRPGHFLLIVRTKTLWWFCSRYSERNS